jgi:hypothetical protein
MFVLLLGLNHSSVINSYCKGLEQHGIQYKALSFELNRSKYVNYEELDVVFKANKYKRIDLVAGVLRLLWIMRKVHVVHVFSDFFIPSRLNKLVSNWIFKRKKIEYLVTFTGSDVRIPEVELRQNPYFKYAYFNPQYEGRLYETKANSLALQKKFSNLKFRLISNPETEPFIQSEMFPSRTLNYHPSCNTLPSIPRAGKGRIKIVHAPSNFYTKGTNFVLEAIRNLEQKFPDKFEFKLLTNVTNAEYQSALRDADILIDQMIWGWYGIAAQQALEFGTTVIAYLEDTKLKLVHDCPIVNANINNLVDILSAHISQRNGLVLKELNIGYYKNYHSPYNVVKRALAFYQTKSCKNV